MKLALKVFIFSLIVLGYSCADDEKYISLNHVGIWEGIKETRKHNQSGLQTAIKTSFVKIELNDDCTGTIEIDSNMGTILSWRVDEKQDKIYWTTKSNIGTIDYNALLILNTEDKQEWSSNETIVAGYGVYGEWILEKVE